MRAIPICILSALAASSFAQLTQTEIDTIQAGFAQLRPEKQVLLVLDGVDQFGTRRNDLAAKAFFKWDPDNALGAVKTDLTEYVNGFQARRITGDGTTLWAYDVSKNAYTTLRYGAYGGTPKKTFRDDMLQELNRASQGPSVFLARMLREIFGGEQANYRTWLPMADITVVSETSKTPTMANPVVPSRVYTGDKLNYYVVYTYASRPQRSSAFHFERADLTTPWYLSEVYYADRQKVGLVNRLVDWRITVYTGSLPSTTDYRFVPPSSARSVANLHGGG